VVVAGSGVTAAATRGDRLSSWSELIASGVEFAARLPGVPPGRLEAARSLLGVGDSSGLISAAELVTESLGGREGGEYARWLRETVGSLELRDRSVPDALAALGVPLATTNYDELIEKACGWERVTWLEGAAMQRALQRDERAVVHLHGHWRTARSVILGVRSYEEANCIVGLGDIARERSDHDAARAAYEQALPLFASIEEPYSVGLIHRRLARVADDPETRRTHVSEARKAWLKIGRQDLAAKLPDCEQ
jgi:hypothetical protein